MWRRDFFKMATATVGLFGAQRLPAQTASPPIDCVDGLSLGEGIRAASYLPVVPNASGGETALRDGYGRAALFVRYPVTRNDEFAVADRQLVLSLEQPEGTNRTLLRVMTSASDCPTVSCDPGEEIQTRIKVDSQHLGRFVTTKNAQDRTPLADRPLLLTTEQARTLRDGNRLWIEVATRDGWERGEISIRNLDNWLKETERFHRNRLRAALAAGGRCQGADATPAIAPCYMTTLLTYRLGRPQSAFELRMLNRLQPHFAKHQSHIVQYVKDAIAVGGKMDDPIVKVASFVFYVVFILPAAALIAARLRLVGGLWYFSGFAILKWVAKLRPS